MRRSIVCPAACVGSSTYCMRSAAFKMSTKRFMTLFDLLSMCNLKSPAINMFDVSTTWDIFVRGPTFFSWSYCNICTERSKLKANISLCDFALVTWANVFIIVTNPCVFTISIVKLLTLQYHITNIKLVEKQYKHRYNIRSVRHKLSII